ncbi:hypothetical protein ACQ4LE_008994 [Meloidogyne hapla]
MVVAQKTRRMRRVENFNGANVTMLNYKARDHVNLKIILVGARTPHYGSSTPAYDGSRTPRQSSASWDPTVSNTPAHSSAHFDDEFDTSGFAGAATPAGSSGGGNRFGGANTPMGKFFFKKIFFLINPKF